MGRLRTGGVWRGCGVPGETVSTSRLGGKGRRGAAHSPGECSDENGVSRTASAGGTFPDGLRAIRKEGGAARSRFLSITALSSTNGNPFVKERRSRKSPWSASLDHFAVCHRGEVEHSPSRRHICGFGAAGHVTDSAEVISRNADCGQPARPSCNCRRQEHQVAL